MEGDPGATPAGGSAAQGRQSVNIDYETQAASCSASQGGSGVAAPVDGNGARTAAVAGRRSLGSAGSSSGGSPREGSASSFPPKQGRQSGGQASLKSANSRTTSALYRRSFFSDSSQDASHTAHTGNSSSARSVRMATKALPEDRLSLLRWTVIQMLCDPRFDAAMGLVILVNSATVGVDQSYRLQDRDTSFIDGLEKFFLVVYSIELGMRLFAFGAQCLEDNWVKFDCVLVVVGLVSLVVEQVLSGSDELGPLMVLRTCRLLRLARTVRLLVKFQVLWMLVRGLVNSIGTMVYTLLILVIIVYIFSCISMEIITTHSAAQPDTDDPAFKEVVDQYFATLPGTMLTLVQFVCLDSVGAIYRPLIKREPALIVYFASILLVVPIVLMNLVTAVIVNLALENAQQDKEAMAIQERQQKERLVKDLRKIFLRADQDGSGFLSADEILGINPADVTTLANLTSVRDPMEIFKQLDLDDSGEIAIDEFCDALWQVVVSKVPAEVRRLERHCQMMERTLTRIGEALNISGSDGAGNGAPGKNGETSGCEEDAVPAGTPPWAKPMIMELRGVRKELAGVQRTPRHASQPLAAKTKNTSKPLRDPANAVCAHSRQVHTHLEEDRVPSEGPGVHTTSTRTVSCSSLVGASRGTEGIVIHEPVELDAEKNALYSPVSDCKISNTRMAGTHDWAVNTTHLGTRRNLLDELDGSGVLVPEAQRCSASFGTGAQGAGQNANPAGHAHEFDQPFVPQPTPKGVCWHDHLATADR